MPLLFSLFLVLLLVLLERLRPGSSDLTDRWSNLHAYWLGWAAQLLLLPLVSLNPLAERFALFDAGEWPLLWAVPAYLILMDLAEFCFHRAQHSIPFLWRMHSLHHSDPNMNATTTVRHFWGDPLIKALTIWPACALILKPTITVVLCYALIANYHFFVHANLRVSFGRWSWLLNHPAYHRRHHSSRPEHFGSNYASLFPIFDILCGTYRRPTEFPPTGLDRKPEGLREIILWPLIGTRAFPVGRARTEG